MTLGEGDFVILRKVIERANGVLTPTRNAGGRNLWNDDNALKWKGVLANSNVGDDTKRKSVIVERVDISPLTPMP